MFTVLSLMTVGIFLGYFLRHKTKIIKSVDHLINVAIYALLFLLGVSVGINETIIKNLDTLGVQAFFLTIGAVLGSVILAFFTYKLFFQTKK